jgi:NADPH2:quinone reductase
MNSSTKAIRIHQTGGPEVLAWEDVPLAFPGPGEVLLRQTAIGLNYIDIYHRSGLYPLAGGLPCILGVEAAGVVEEIGPDVELFRPGDRVAYAPGPIGAYCQHRVFPAERLIPLPDGLDDRLAAAALLRGMTVRYLLRQTCPVQPGDIILVHAAAGGVGLLLCQWAKALGVTVIGTVSSSKKAEHAAAHGCDHPILYSEEDFVARVREITNNQGVRVVYDSVGRTTFLRSLECLRPLGMLVSYGQSSGPIDPFDPGVLASKGSLFLTRPSLFHYVAQREALLDNAQELFGMIQKGLKIEIGQSFKLENAADAHYALEKRETVGSTILIP